MNKLTWRLSPSIIESYFSHNGCLRGLVSAGLKDNDTRSAFGFTTVERGRFGERSAISKAGDTWEALGLEKLRERWGEESIIKNPETDDYGITGSYSEDELVKILKELYTKCKTNPDKRYYIYQGEIEISDAFITEMLPDDISEEDLNCALGKSDKFAIDRRKTKPDLLRVEWSKEHSKLLLSIVDFKLAKKPKIEHKMQICMYIILLQDLIDRKALAGSCIANRSEGFLFNYGKDEETSFDTAIAFNYLTDFFSTYIPQIIQIARKEIPDGEKFEAFDYCISQKCEWCPDYSNCIGKCKKNREELMLIPYITRSAQDRIREIKEDEDSGLDELSCNGLKAYLESEENIDDLSENAYWKRFMKDKDKVLNMLSLRCENDAMNMVSRYELRDKASTEFLKSENVQVILTSQKDSGYDLPYFWGVRVKLASDNKHLLDVMKTNGSDDERFQTSVSYGTDGFIEIKVIVKDMAYQSDAAWEFVRLWHQMLSIVADYNFNTGSTLTLQQYVMDNYELSNLEETLFAVIEDHGCPKEASELIMLLHGQRLVGSDSVDDRPDTLTDCPVTVITSEVSKLFILPTLIANNIVDVCTAFNVDKKAVKALDNEAFRNKLSNVIKNDAINRYWDPDKRSESDLEKIMAYMSNRLYAESDLIKKIRGADHPGIICSPSAFSIPKEDTTSCLELRKLAFEAKYEYMLEYQRFHQIRSDCNKALEDGNIWVLTEPVISKTKNENTRIDFKLKDPGNFNRTNLYSACICRRTDINIKALRFYNETLSEEHMRFLKKTYKGCTFYDVSNIQFADGSHITVYPKDLKFDNANGRFNPNDEYLLFEIQSDYNYKKCKAEQQELDGGDSIIVRPWELYKKTNDDYGTIEDSLIKYGETLDNGKPVNFTASQLNALKQLYEYNITVLLGPPGTGKTNFIARALIANIRLNKSQGKNMRVLVCANSHAAIENVLLKAYEMAESLGLKKEDLYFAKLSKIYDPALKRKVIDLSAKKEAEVDSELEKRPFAIIGSTMWRKYIPKGFDYIVIDEASQVRMIDSIIPLSRGKVESSKYLIVGDENQLPPIIHGQYETDPNKPYLFGSVFRYFYDCDRMLNKDNGLPSYVCQLNENFRMNDAICRYSAIKIYNGNGNEYKAANAAIGTQTLEKHIGDAAKIKELIDSEFHGDPDADIISSILDPDYPLVLCCVKGNNSVLERQREVEIVTKVVKALQKALENSVGNDYDSAQFWTKYFGIVSPHHEHINRLKSEICEPGREDEVFIGTVDKLQGQERESIIVSYGVTDVEQAIAEKEFIYSRNRLNVAITRAKKKCIVFLSDVLLKYPIQALEYDDPDLICGFDYVCGLREFVEENKDSKYLEIQSGDI